MKMNKNEIKMSPEEELDLFIDALNQERRPEEGDEAEISELQSIVRKVRRLRPIEEPSQKFAEDLQQELISKFRPRPKSESKSQKRTLPWIALVAGFLTIIFLISPWSNTKNDIVLAMEQSVNQLQNYHGTLEKISTNAAGERQILQRTEIWSEGGKYATRSEEGIVTVNNGVNRWETDPQRKEILQLPLYLDPHDFDLRNEAAKALQYPHTIVGEESIAGRTATRLEIAPPGGLPYYLWIDSETHLPIQLQTAMQKSLQTTYTFLTLETNLEIPETTFTYNPPADYRIIDQNPDKRVANLTEAINVSGLTPLQLSEKPQRIFASTNRIVFDFEDTIVIESAPASPFVLNPLAVLGQAERGPLEVLPDSLRWQQKDLEIKVQGQRTEELAKQLTPNLEVTPQKGQVDQRQPSIPVEVDMEVVKNNQQQVDAGSSPWQLDPMQVAFTFAALQISPEGIKGEPPLDYKTLELVENNGQDAVIEISEGPIKTIYVKRLIRQDTSGIWTVVGYDPR